MSKKTNLSLNKLHEVYIKKCTIRNLSERTIKSYIDHYKQFTDFIDGDTLISEVTEDTIDDFVIHLHDNNDCNAITVNSYLRTIRAFLYFCMDGGYLRRFTVRLIKAEKKVKETYSDAELELLLKKPNTKTCTFKEYQMWVYSNYLLATGNRISSVLNVKIKDLDFDNLYIRISKTKSRRQQIIPMSTTLSERLQEYLLIRGGEPDDYVFCTVTGKKATVRGYQDALKRYNLSRGVAKTSSHLYRHTFAKNWIKNNGDIFRLQKMLGHSTLDVTREYVNMFSTDLSDDFEKFNPLDQMVKDNNKEHIRMK